MFQPTHNKRYFVNLDNEEGVRMMWLTSEDERYYTFNLSATLPWQDGITWEKTAQGQVIIPREDWLNSDNTPGFKIIKVTEINPFTIPVE